MRPRNSTKQKTMKNTPYTMPKLTGIALMDALPPVRRAEMARHAIGRLQHALEDSRNHSAAYEILANFGEMTRTASGYRTIDPEAVIARCRRTIETLAQYL